MKAAGAIIIAGVVLVGGVLWYQSMQAVETDVASAPTEAAPTQAATPENVVIEAPVEAAEQVVDTAQAAAEAAVQAAEDAAKAARKAAEEAAEAAQTAIGAGTTVGSDVAVETTAVAGGVNQSAQDVAAKALDAVKESVADVNTEANSTLASPLDVLTTRGFDYDKVVELIDGSSLDLLKKTTLKTAVTQVKDKPALLQATLDQVKQSLGL